jgi:hypothetical protein
MSQTKLFALAALLALGVGASAHAQRVTRDSVTGELRAPTADEVKAMDGSSRAKRAVGIHSGKADPQAVRMPDGTVMQELTTDTLMYSVARKNADGSISQYCVAGDEAAQRLVKGKQARTQSFAKAGKEQAYEVK